MATSTEINLDENQLSTAICQILECIVCLQPSVSPIYECLENCHFTCAKCYNQMPVVSIRNINIVKCAMGKNNLQKSTCGERLSRKYGMKSLCPNNESGCEANALAHNLREHLEICEYRPIPCACHNSAQLWVDCQGPCDLVLMREFPDHWTQKTSALSKDRLSQVDINKFHISFYIPSILNPNCDYSNEYWDGKHDASKYGARLMQWGSHAFLLMAYHSKDTFHWWMLILGGQKDANKFNYSTKMFLGNKRNDDIEEVIWKLPVLPFHEYAKFDKYCGKYASCSASRIAEFHVNEYNEDSPHRALCNFYVKVEIQFLKTTCNK